MRTLRQLKSLFAITDIIIIMMLKVGEEQEEGLPTSMAGNTEREGDPITYD